MTLAENVRAQAKQLSESFGLGQEYQHWYIVDLCGLYTGTDAPLDDRMVDIGDEMSPRNSLHKIAFGVGFLYQVIPSLRGKHPEYTLNFP